MTDFKVRIETRKYGNSDLCSSRNSPDYRLSGHIRTVLPEISVIICTYNRCCMLNRLLEALSRQTAPPGLFEVVVSDDGSTDDTPRVAAKWEGCFSRLVFVSVGTNQGLASARNRAVHAGRGRLLFFVDDDCVPRKDWVERLHEAMRKEAVVAGAVETDRVNFWMLSHNIGQFHQVMPGSRNTGQEDIAGANMGMRREIFLELGGFEEGRRSADDTELAFRARAAGHRICFAPEALVLHKPARTSFKKIIKHASYRAEFTILLRLRFKTLLRTPLVLKDPALLLAASPLLALAVSMSIFIRNPRLLRHVFTWPIIFLIKMAWCWGAARGLARQRRSAPCEN